MPKLPMYTFEEALEIIDPCSYRYDVAWCKARFPGRKKINALDILSIRAKYFRWTHGSRKATLEARRDSKVYACMRLLPQNSSVYYIFVEYVDIFQRNCCNTARRLLEEYVRGVNMRAKYHYYG